MSAGTKRWRSAVAGALLVGVVGGALVAGQASASGPKAYAVSSDQSGIYNPSTGSPVQVSITLTNTSRNPISFSAANLTIPNGLTVTGIAASRGNWNVVGSIVELRGLGVARGATVTVDFSVTMEPNEACGYTIASAVRQANNFNGNGNAFPLVGEDAFIEGPCGEIVTCDVDADCASDVTSRRTGNSAQVAGPGFAGALETYLVEGDNLACRYKWEGNVYDATSDLLFFDVNADAAITSGMKTITFSQTADPAKQYALEYQVCFQAPYDFPSLPWLASSWPYVRSTEAVGDQFKGLLLPCAVTEWVWYPLTVEIGGATFPAPCVDERVISEGGVVTVVLKVPAADPLVRF